jgi:hypothetical protein
MAPRRYFTVDEVNRILPKVRSLFDRVLQLRAQLKSSYQALETAGYAPTRDELGSLASDDSSDGEKSEVPEEVDRQKRLFRAMVETLRDQLEEIQATGCVIKDVEEGLVDWYGRHQGRDIFLCWKYGERELAHWHELQSGFSGRRPIEELSETGAEDPVV